ncbi:MAG TPA: hypothetical protein PK208_13820 [Fibrobacteria bacterium]|nr:hypothetical protein [Fibrobacteria bacterium]
MNVHGRISLGLCLVAWLAACSDKLRSSTEVENEIVARSLQGVAMDSVALDSAAWTAWDATGAVIAAGVTDSVGGFRSELPRAPVGGILVRVCGRGDTLRSLVPVDGSVVRSGVATVLVHPLSSVALGPLPRDPSEGFPASDVASAESNGQKLLDDVLGVGLPWRELRSDSGFRAYDRKRSGVPAPAAGFVRAVSVRAARDGAAAADWLDARRSGGGATVASDSSFERDLVASMAALGLPSRVATEYVVRLDGAADRGGRWEERWRTWRVIPDSASLARRIPWAVDPRFVRIWTRLVESTTDRAASWERSLPPSERVQVRPGRAHELVVETIGPLVEPDPAVSAEVAEAALDTFLVRVVPQTFLFMERMRPQAWGGMVAPDPLPPPGPADPGGAVGRLLRRTLQRGFAADWKYHLYQSRPDFDLWLDSRFRPLSNAQEAADTLRAEWTAHPDPELPAELLR